MDDRLLTKKDVTTMLRISKRFLIKLDADGVLPAIRIGNKDKTGGHRRWKLSDIEKYMNEGHL